MGLGSFCIFRSILFRLPRSRLICRGMNLAYFRKRRLAPVDRPNDCLENAELLLLDPDKPNGGYSAHQENSIAALLAGAGGPRNNSGVEDPEKKRRP